MIIENSHAESPETDCTTVDDKGGVVAFINELACLGSIINFLPDDTVDTQSRAYESSESVGN